MPTPAEKLAQSLEVLKQLQDEGHSVLKSSQITRTHRERLSDNGYLFAVVPGWYIRSLPTNQSGESTVWYSSYWEFCCRYLNEKYHKNWCISAEQSIQIHSGNSIIPTQLIVRSTIGSNNYTKLPYNTTLLVVKSNLPKSDEVIVKDQCRIYSLESALINCAPNFFKTNPEDIRTALLLVKDSSQILYPLLKGGHTRAAGRLAGAFRNINKPDISNEIVKTMKASLYDVREYDPFDCKIEFTSSIHLQSPVTTRLKIKWETMRKDILELFPPEETQIKNIDEYIEHMEEVYETDAYHSLSIEGYNVNPELIAKVKTGNWNPDLNKEDQDQREAMAAKGYHEAFLRVKKSIRDMLTQEKIYIDRDLSDWYLSLFSPGVNAGILRPEDLAGFRSHPVYIKNSMHVPFSPEAVREAMPVFYDLITSEEQASVRAVLGHFIFVFIHPFMDGNGRIARFLMNSMLATGGYKWMVVTVDSRDEYMGTLEIASVHNDIRPFAQFIRERIVSYS